MKSFMFLACLTALIGSLFLYFQGKFRFLGKCFLYLWKSSHIFRTTHSLLVEKLQSIIHWWTACFLPVPCHSGSHCRSSIRTHSSLVKISTEEINVWQFFSPDVFLPTLGSSSTSQHMLHRCPECILTFLKVKFHFKCRVAPNLDLAEDA